MIQYNIMKYNEIDYQLYDTIYPLIFLHFLSKSLYLKYLVSFKYYILRRNGLDQTNWLTSVCNVSDNIYHNVSI